MGRPRKGHGEGRSERLPGLRVTPAELVYAETLADRSGQALADLQRRSLFGLPMPPARDARDLDALIVAVNRVGNNVNQIARAIHRGRPVPADELAAVLDEVKATLARLTEPAGL